jgi:hypothetical protein
VSAVTCCVWMKISKERKLGGQHAGRAWVQPYPTSCKRRKRREGEGGRCATAGKEEAAQREEEDYEEPWARLEPNPGHSVGCLLAGP